MPVARSGGAGLHRVGRCAVVEYGKALGRRCVTSAPQKGLERIPSGGLVMNGRTVRLRGWQRTKSDSFASDLAKWPQDT